MLAHRELAKKRYAAIGSFGAAAAVHCRLPKNGLDARHHLGYQQLILAVDVDLRGRSK